MGEQTPGEIGNGTRNSGESFNITYETTEIYIEWDIFERP